jgi:hypothetical protein
VAAYVSALDAHDIVTARALLTPAHARVVQGAADSWFRNVVSIKQLQMNKPFKDPYDARHLHYNHCVGMGVSFALEQHQVMSMPNGPTVWGYTLCRNSRGRRWRIADEGTG